MERPTARSAGHSGTSGSGEGVELHPAGPLWARELTDLAGQLRSVQGVTDPSLLRERIWLIVSLAVRRYLGMHRARSPWISTEEIEDISSQKSLELVERIVSLTWVPGGRTAAEVAAYISTATRNALADYGRGAARRVDLEPQEWERSMADANPQDSAPMDRGDPAEISEFTRDLLKCLGSLQPRARLLWFFRAFYDLSSREIAAHPRIQLEVGHVDVLMQRTRELIQQCLGRAGHDVSEIPAGVYARVWEASRSWGVDPTEDSR